VIRRTRGFTGAVTRFLLLPILLVALVAIPAAAPATAAPAKPGATKKRCPSGTTPVVRKKGKRAVPKRDRKGRLRCKAIKVGKPPAPAATPAGQAGNVADALHGALAINPRAAAKLERTLGKRRARRMIAVTLDGWQKAAVTARASQDTDTTTFAPSKGVTGTLTIGTQESSGSDSGFTATVNAQVDATREGIGDLAPGLKDKLPSDVKRVKGEVDVKFEDAIAACPSDKGEREGKVKANGKVKITVERDGKPPIETEFEVSVETGYTSRADGTIDVETSTSFRTSETGSATRTYRGRRLGNGFGRESIIDGGAGNVESGVQRDVGHFDSAAGGVFGPKGGWNYARGIGVSDLRSIENVNAMVTTAVNTDLLTLAALEYVRKKALPRAEEEECGYTVALNIDGRGVFATHDASGQLAVTAPATQVGDGAWTAQAPAAWTGLTFTTKGDCAYVSPVSPAGTLTVELDRTDAGRLAVTWRTDPSILLATASVDCPPSGDIDPPPISGQPGPGLPGITPLSFELPLEGGSQAVTGGVVHEGDGWYNDGVLTVTRVR
jgi:hypothetical protein